ncbi:MAG: thioredoxin-dependent thiol peroxidase [Candidatus Thermoplasmatota archaeon]|nr:thioredoxin-dependent thiol peroxidase [Candidatus Thermoplasmatota archaeon]MEE3242490.1 thioredoxin-dependent thiol peroxidase [Candidatus Thermoplasmatota archaeon]
MSQIPEIGGTAPDFALPNQEGKSVKLSDSGGKWLVVYFYPKDDTPGCTVEAIEFTELRKQFENENAVLLGVSPDTKAKHCKFIDKHKLGIDLLADIEKTMLSDYGVWQEKSMYGRTYMGVVRTTCLIDPKGKIAEVWTKVKAKGHAEAVLERLREIKG